LNRLLHLPSPWHSIPPRPQATSNSPQSQRHWGYKGDWSGLFAGLVMAMLPVLAAYIIFQRQVVQGLTAGALK
ncbi:carbohydrate ABC transporter permease, partial [Streptomyces sp. NPDC004227]